VRPPLMPVLNFILALHPEHSSILEHAPRLNHTVSVQVENRVVAVRFGSQSILITFLDAHLARPMSIRRIKDKMVKGAVRIWQLAQIMFDFGGNEIRGRQLKLAAVQLRPKNSFAKGRITNLLAVLDVKPRYFGNEVCICALARCKNNVISLQHVIKN